MTNQQAPSKFKKKSVEIEAIQFNGNNALEVSAFIGKEIGLLNDDSPDAEERKLFIDTLEGQMIASCYDWIIKGVKGEFYPCKPDIFEMTYSPTGQAPSATVDLDDLETSFIEEFQSFPKFEDGGDFEEALWKLHLKYTRLHESSATFMNHTRRKGKMKTPNNEDVAERLFDKYKTDVETVYGEFAMMEYNEFKKALTEYSASLFTEEQAKDIYTVGYVDGTAYMSNAIAQAFGAEVTSEELNADKAIEKYRNELTDKGK